MKNSRSSRIALIIVSSLLCSLAVSQEKPTGSKPLGKFSTTQSHSYFTINNIFSQYANNLKGAVNLTTEQASGFEWPKGSNKFAVYMDGFVYGGYYRGRAAAV